MKRFLLILVAVACAVLPVSAQKREKRVKKSISVSFDMTYNAEVNVGFAVTGSSVKTYDAEGDYEKEVAAVFSRPFVETIHGYQIGKYLFAGAGIGLQYYTGKLHSFQEYADLAAVVKGKSNTPVRWNAFATPIFANVRFMYPVKKNLLPFINLGIGGTPIFCSAINATYTTSEEDLKITHKSRLRGGLYCDFGGGVRWKGFGASIGLQHQALKVVDILTVEGSKRKSQSTMNTNAFYVKIGYHF